MIDFEILKKTASRYPEIVPAKDGNFTLQTGQQFAHSSYSPVKEARRLVEDILPLDPDKTLVVFIGAGLGYHIDILENSGFNRFIIIEKNPKIFEIFNQIFRPGKQTHLVGPDDLPEKLDGIFSQFELQDTKTIKTVILRGNYNSEIYRPTEERLERLLKVKLGDFATRLNFEEIWFTNILKNIRNLKTSGTIASLFGKAQDLPVLIVSAGPSLKFSLKEIKKAAPFCILIAADTALLPLYEADISPDFVYTLDSQIYNLCDFSMIDKKYLSSVRLIYDLVVNPSLPPYFYGLSGNGGPVNTFAANTAHLELDLKNRPYFIKNEFSAWLEKTAALGFGDIETGGSVSTSAFHFAFLTGGNPILLTGQDLAYTFNSTHSTSTSHFYRIQKQSGRLRPIASVFMDIIHSRKTMEVQPLHPGKPEDKLLTDFVLNNYKGWFEESAEKISASASGVSFGNASFAGGAIAGFEPVSLSEWAARNKTKISKEERAKRFHANLIESAKVDRIWSKLLPLEGFLRTLKPEPSLFGKIESSEWPFLNRYFMKERTVYERYGKLEKGNMERKTERLIKNLKGPDYGKK